MKLSPKEINLFEEENREELKNYHQMVDDDLEKFTEEIILEDSEWFKERKVEFLIQKLAKIQTQIDFWEKLALIYPGWFGDVIIESNVSPDKKKQKMIKREIDFYQKPIAKNYDRPINDDDIQMANQVDCAELIPIKRKIGNKNLALCPFHKDHNPSFVCFPPGHGYHCFACGAHGSAINLMMKLNNLSFVNAVKQLRRY